MNVEWFIARRYLWSSRRHPFVRVAGALCTAGIAVGVAALIVVLAVMNGFDEDLKRRLLGTRAHVVIEKEGAFTDVDGAVVKALSVGGVTAAAPFVEGQALLQAGEWGSGVLVRGVDVPLETKAAHLSRSISSGVLSGRAGFIVVGSEAAKKIGVRLGSRVQVLTSAMEKPRVFTVEGLFTSGLYDYDANLAFVGLGEAQSLFGLGDAVSGVSVWAKDAGGAAGLKRGLEPLFGHPYFVRTWMELNATLFGALRLEKTVMFVILSLIVLVACLNVAGILTVLVIDKTKDIGTLKALGATPKQLVAVFALDGLGIGACGAAVGLAGGLLLCWLLETTRWIELPREIYFMDRLPVHANAADTAAVVCVAVILSFLSSVFPAVSAGRLDAARALRYE